MKTTHGERRTVLLMTHLVMVGTAGVHAVGAAAPVVIELPPADRQLLGQILGAGVVGEAVAALPIQEPAELFPLRSKTLTYQSTRAGRQGKSEEHVIRPQPQAGSGTRWEYATGPGDVAHLLQSADGSISVGSEEDARHGVLSQFTPAEPVLLKGMTPGETRESRIDVRVSDCRQTDRLRYRGWLQLTYSYPGAYRVQVPAGSYTASLFKWQYNGRIGPARITEIQYRFFVEGMGPVATASRTDIRASWIYRDVSRNGSLLMRPALALNSH
jgi:hypothetical protein